VLPSPFANLPPTDFTHGRNLWLKPQPELQTLKPGDKVITYNACIGYKIEGDEDSYVQSSRGAQFDVADGDVIDLHKGQILVRGGAEAVSVNTGIASSIVPAGAIALVEASGNAPTVITLLDDPSKIGTLVFFNGNSYMLRKGERLIAQGPLPIVPQPGLAAGSGAAIANAGGAHPARRTLASTHGRNGGPLVASLPQPHYHNGHYAKVPNNQPVYQPAPKGVQNNQMPGVVSYGFIRHHSTVNKPQVASAGNQAGQSGNSTDTNKDLATANLDADTQAQIKRLVDIEQPHPGDLSGSGAQGGGAAAPGSGAGAGGGTAAPTVATVSVPLGAVMASSNLVACASPKIRQQLGVGGWGGGAGGTEPKKGQGGQEGLAEKYKGARTSLPQPVKRTAVVSSLPRPIVPAVFTSHTAVAPTPQPMALSLDAVLPSFATAQPAAPTGRQLPSLPLAANYAGRSAADISAIYQTVARYQGKALPVPQPQALSKTVADPQAIASAYKQDLDASDRDDSHLQAVAWQAPTDSLSGGAHTTEGGGLVRVSDGVYKLDRGGAYVSPAEAARVDIPGGSVFVGGHNTVYISVEKRITRVMDLHDSSAKSVRVVYNQHLLPLYPGAELNIVDADQVHAGDVIMSDGIGRREMRILSFEEGGFVVVDDFSITNALANVPRLKELYRSDAKEDRASVAAMLKMAAILSYMYDPVKGPFTAAAIAPTALAETLNMQVW
jgi:hypothetical protein